MPNQRSRRLFNQRDEVAHIGAVAVRPASPQRHGWPLTDLASIRARIEKHPLDRVLAATNCESAAIADTHEAARTLKTGPYTGYTVSAAGLAVVAQQALAVCVPQGYVPPRDLVPISVRNAVRAGAIDVYYHRATNLEGSVSLRDLTAVFYRLMGAHAGAQIRYRYTVPRYLSLFQQPIQSHHKLGDTLGDAFHRLTGISYDVFVSLTGLLSVASLTVGVLPTSWIHTLFNVHNFGTWCTPENVTTTLALLSLPFEEHIAETQRPICANVNDAPFGFGSLRRRPLIQLGDEGYLAPVPQLLWGRVFGRGNLEYRGGIARTGG